MSKSKSRNSHQKRELKQQLVKKHGSICQICKKPFPLHLLTLDHIIPLDIEPDWNIRNLQLACYPCNQQKSNEYVDPWELIKKGASKNG